jgi:mannosyltransferase OCH1-like enzyme
MSAHTSTPGDSNDIESCIAIVGHDETKDDRRSRVASKLSLFGFLGVALLFLYISHDHDTLISRYNHRHKIPNIMYFTYSYNLLDVKDRNDFKDSEDFILAENVRNTISLHPNTKVVFLTDADCLEYVRDIAIDGLESFFLKEEKGMIKADICRGAALYKTGGLYFDVDLQARASVWDLINSNLEFVVPLVHKDHKVKGSFFQAFIAITAHNPIMIRYLQMFVEYYEGKRSTNTPSIGVVLLREAYDDIKDNHFEDVTMFWQETKYKKDKFPDVEPTSGERRACHMIVNIPSTSTVPFYSRVRGSRLCGGKESVAMKKI